MNINGKIKLTGKLAILQYSKDSGSYRCSRHEWVKVDTAWLSLLPLPVPTLLGLDLPRTPGATPRPRAAPP